jgi:hypothetical protein
MIRRLSVCLVLAVLTAATPSLAAKKALFDNTHAQTAGNADWIIDTDQPLPVPAQSTVRPGTARTIWLGAISSWAVDLVKRGYEVATLTTAYGITYNNATNPYDLSKYDVFIVDEPNTRFTRAESTAIFNYVRDGGGLVAVSDHAISDRNNDGVDSPKAWGRLDRLHLFGAHFDSTGEGTSATNNFVQDSYNIDTALDNPVIRGAVGNAAAVSFHNGTSMHLYPAANPSVRGDIWMTGLAHGNAGVMVAHSTYGSGRVFFIGDSSPCDDGSAQPGNSSIYDGWAEAAGNDSILIMNGTMWATRVAGDTQAPSVTVSAANGSETWACGSVHNITWTATDNVAVVSVTVEFSINNGGSWTTLGSGLANSGTYAWTVPNTPTSQGLVRVTAYDAVPLSAGDVSNAAFTIADQTAPTATLSAPNGGESIPSGSTQAITWSAADNVAVTAVDLYISTDNGANYSLIASGEAHDGSYSWLVPAAATSEALVRVVAHDAAGGTAQDASNAVFYIGSSTGTGNLPATFGRALVMQNRPNPFNPSTLIGYGLPAAGRATITIYSVRGEVVRRLLDADCPQGYGEVRWDGRDDAGQSVPSGPYFYRLQAGGVTSTKRLVLAK